MTGLPAELADWNLDDILHQITAYSARRLLELRDLAEPGSEWRRLLEVEIIRCCELGGHT